MVNRWAVATLCVLALSGTGVALRIETSDREAARLLFRTLDRYSYYYYSLRTAESRLGESEPTAQEAVTRLREIEGRILYLTGGLNSLRINGHVRRELLEPLVHGLQDDHADLASLREHIERSGLDIAARARLRKHVHPPDVFRPVIGEIRLRYGLRQRLWRGHPLTV